MMLKVYWGERRWFCEDADGRAFSRRVCYGVSFGDFFIGRAKQEPQP